MLQEIKTTFEKWQVMPTQLKTVAVFATVAGERVQVDFMRGSDRFGWWVVKPIKGGEWYFVQRDEMTHITRQFKLV